MPYQIFLSSCFDSEMQQNRELFRANLIARFNECSGQYGENTYITDFEYGIPDGLKAEQIIDICVSSVKKSDLFMCVFGKRYGFLIDRKRVPLAFIELRNLLMPEAVHDKWVSFFEIEILTALLFIPEKSCFLVLDTSERDERSDRLLNVLITCGYDVRFFESKEELAKLAVDRFIEYSGYVNEVEKFETSSTNTESGFNSIKEASSLTASQMQYLSRKLRYSIPQEEILSKLSAYVNGFSTSTFVLVGDHDSGKSVLLAEWVRRNKERKDISIHCWFHEEGAENLSVILMELLAKEHGIGEFFYQDDAIHTFYSVATKKYEVKQLFILDGIDHLDEAMKAGWLITRTNPTVKIIITLRGDLSSYLPEDHVIIEKIYPIPALKLIKHIYDKEGKGLEYPYIQSILADICKNWSLRQITEGIQQFLRIMKYQPGSITEVNNVNEIKEYLKKFDSIYGVFNNTKSYLEDNFHANVVHDSISLIALTEKGLTRSELSDLMNGKIEIFYQLYYVLIQNEDLYMLPENIVEWQINSIPKSEILKYRKKIITYFENIGNDRALIEICWQLVKLPDKQRLVTFLSSIKNWSLIHSNSSLFFAGIDHVLSKKQWNQIVNCWQKQLAMHPDNYSEQEIYTISNALDMLCRIEEAADVMGILLQRNADDFSMASYHQQIASLYEDVGDERAIEHSEKAIYLIELTEDKAFVQNKIDTYLAGAYTYANFIKMKDYSEQDEKIIIDKLECWIQKVVDLMETVNYKNPNYLVLNYHNIAYVYWNTKQFELAIRFIDLALSRSRPDKSLTVSDLKLRAQINNDIYCAHNECISDETGVLTVIADHDNEYLMIASKDLERAMELQQQLKQEEGNTSYLDEMAELHYVVSQNCGYRGDYRKSIQAIDIALEMEKETDVAHDFYATYYQAAIARLGAYSEWREMEFLSEALEFLEMAEEEINQSGTIDAHFYLNDVLRVKEFVLKELMIQN